MERRWLTGHRSPSRWAPPRAIEIAPAPRGGAPRARVERATRPRQQIESPRQRDEAARPVVAPPVQPAHRRGQIQARTPLDEPEVEVVACPEHTRQAPQYFSSRKPRLAVVHVDRSLAMARDSASLARARSCCGWTRSQQRRHDRAPSVHRRRRTGRRAVGEDRTAILPRPPPCRPGARRSLVPASTARASPRCPRLVG